jgi:phosphate:Na+ symporter
MSFALAGIIPVDLAFALVLGANIGSGIIPVVLTLSADPIAKRIPLGNLLFRTVGALIMLFALEWLAPYMSHLGAEPARQVANFHTIFNLVLAAAFLPFVNFGATLVTRIYPGAKGEEGRAQTRYLDESVVDTPSLALAAASREVIRMADIVEAMLNETIKVFETNDEKRVAALSKMDDDVDHLYEEIKFYLARVSRGPLGEGDSNRCVDLITFVTNLEHIGDIIDKNLVEIARKKITKKLSFSDEGWSELTELHARVVNQMKLAMNLFVSGDLQIARLLLTEKERFRGLERGAGEKHLDRLRSGRIESIETSALHLDILRDFKRINSHLTSLAYPVLDAEGELRESRLRVTTPKEA